MWKFRSSKTFVKTILETIALQRPMSLKALSDLKNFFCLPTVQIIHSTQFESIFDPFLSFLTP